MYTGIAPVDAINLPRLAYSGHAITASRSKTGNLIYWPAIRQLRAALDSAPDHDAPTLLANRNRKPWTLNGWNTAWPRD